MLLIFSEPQATRSSQSSGLGDRSPSWGDLKAIRKVPKSRHAPPPDPTWGLQPAGLAGPVWVEHPRAGMCGYRKMPWPTSTFAVLEAAMGAGGRTPAFLQAPALAPALAVSREGMQAGVTPFGSRGYGAQRGWVTCPKGHTSE